MDQYRQNRVKRLQQYIGEQGLDAMLITSQDAIYYLSGASYTPVERPFFIIIRPEGSPSLVVPRLEYEHMMKVEGFGDIHYYFEYPSIPGQNWYDYIAQDVRENASSALSRRCRLHTGTSSWQRKPLSLTILTR